MVLALRNQPASLLLLLPLLLCLMFACTANAFVPHHQNRKGRGTHAAFPAASTRPISRSLPASSLSFSSKVYLSSWNHDERHYEDAFQRNMLRTDPRIFLTQRALQSFIFLAIAVRDPHTVKYLEETYELGDFTRYHGTGAINVTQWSEWDSILLDMLHRPTDVIVVSARRRGRGNGGWSKNNPYMEDRFVEFNIDIDPASLASRIVSVREQIAREWVADMDTLMAADEMILASYHDKTATGRAQEECVEFDEDCNSTEDLVVPSSSDKTTRPRAFDRNAMMMLSNSILADTVGSSPHRKGNFDLLILMATQESVHRVLRHYKEAGSVRKVPFAWLREFYIQRVTTHFDGDQQYGRADDFLDELLFTSPVMREVNGKVELVDPLRIAEDLISMRSQVASEWKSIAETIPEEHTELRKALLDKQMGKYSQPPNEAQVKEASASEFE